MNAVCAGARPKIPGDVPTKLRNVLKACWQPLYKKRPNIGEVFQMLDLKGKCPTACDLICENPSHIAKGETAK